MSNICAGIGRGQMTILEEHVLHHKRIHALYEEAFKTISGISLLSNPDSNFESNYWLSTVLIESNIAGFDCNKLRKFLDEKGIETRPLWKPLHLQPVFSKSPRYIDGTSKRIFD